LLHSIGIAKMCFILISCGYTDVYALSKLLSVWYCRAMSFVSFPKSFTWISWVRFGSC